MCICSKQERKNIDDYVQNMFKLGVLKSGKRKIGSTTYTKSKKTTNITTQHIKLFLSFNLMIFALKSRMLSNNKRRETAPRMRLIQCIPDAKDTLNDFLFALFVIFSLFIFVVFFFFLFSF